MQKRSSLSAGSVDLGLGSNGANFDLWGRITPPNRVALPTQMNRSHFRVVRPSIGIKHGQGAWSFSCGDRLDGVPTAHPVNASRKLIIHTEGGTFSLNEEDLEEV